MPLPRRWMDADVCDCHCGAPRATSAIGSNFTYWGDCCERYCLLLFITQIARYFLPFLGIVNLAPKIDFRWGKYVDVTRVVVGSRNAGMEAVPKKVRPISKSDHDVL